MTKQEKDKLMQKHFGLGCILSPTDERDWSIANVANLVNKMTQEKLPASYEVPVKMKVLNQGSVGSCVAHAVATAMGYGESKLKVLYHDYSRGMIYANRKENDYNGEGMYIRQALKNLNHDGDCFNIDFDYNLPFPQVKAKFDEKKEILLQKAAPYAIENYFRLTSEDEIKHTLLNTGSVILSIPVYSNFGAVTPLPSPNEKSEGNHAICLVGWDSTGWLLQNSWGSVWGKKGFFHIPYNYPVNEWWGFTINTGKKSKKTTCKIIDNLKNFCYNIFTKLKKK